MALYVFDGYPSFLDAVSGDVDPDTVNHVRRQPAFSTVSSLISQAGAHDDPKTALEIIGQAKLRAQALNLGYLAAVKMIDWAESQILPDVVKETEEESKPKRGRQPK